MAVSVPPELARETGSATVAKPVTEEVFKVGNSVDLLDRSVDVVFNPAVADSLAVKEDVAGTPIAVPRLTDRTNIAQGLSAIEVIAIVNFFGTVKFQRLREDARNVGVTLETIAVHESKNALHLPLIVNILGKNVFVQRIASRPVDIEKAVLPKGTRSFGEEFPASLPILSRLDGGLELGPGPEDGPLGWGIESFRVKHCALIVIAQENNLALHDQIHAFAWIGAVANHVSQTIDFCYIACGYVVENSLQGFKVAMNIAYYRLHLRASPGDWPRSALPVLGACLTTANGWLLGSVLSQ
jgi:hypothetical protein